LATFLIDLLRVDCSLEEDPSVRSQRDLGYGGGGDHHAGGEAAQEQVAAGGELDLHNKAGGRSSSSLSCLFFVLFVSSLFALL
jgi:hypothetical protein